MLKTWSVRPAGDAVSLCDSIKREVLRTLQRKDLLVRMHNRRVCGDWSPEDIVRVGEVHDDDLVGFIDLFPDTDEMVGFQRKSLRWCRQ